MVLSRKRRFIFLILTIFWSLLIFWFSSRNGSVSTGDSDAAGSTLLKIFIKDFNSLDPLERAKRLELLTYPIRKIAHGGEYAILSSLIMGIFIGLKNKIVLEAIFSWAIASLYAVTDEIHQLFVPGRSGQVIDVIIDSSGAFIGVLIISLIILKVRKGKSL